MRAYLMEALTYEMCRTTVAWMDMGVGFGCKAWMEREVIWSWLRRIGGWGALPVLLAAAAGLAQTPEVKAFHPAGTMTSYEVATIKPADPDKPFAGMTLRRYIATAYDVPMAWGMPGVELQGSRVIGGPEWIDKDRYDINGKPPDELREVMQKMSPEDRRAQEEMMEQSLLAERFHLKVHFETHEMTVFELVPAKGGMKITAVDPPTPGGMRPGRVELSVANNGLNILNAHEMTLEMLANAIRGQAAEIGGRPVINSTGFHGNFDLKDFRFAGLAYTQGPAGASAAEPDAPSLPQALEQQLGLKLVRGKGQVEVVVIDSIDRPTEN
jgi:uncharacterized protein (TIGR03435 family)